MTDAVAMLHKPLALLRGNAPEIHRINEDLRIKFTRVDWTYLNGALSDGQLKPIALER